MLTELTLLIHWQCCFHKFVTESRNDVSVLHLRDRFGCSVSPWVCHFLLQMDREFSHFWPHKSTALNMTSMKEHHLIVIMVNQYEAATSTWTSQLRTRRTSGTDSFEQTTNSHSITTSSCARQCCSRQDRALRPATVHQRPTESERSRTWQSHGWAGKRTSSTTRWSIRLQQAARWQARAKPAASCSRRQSARREPFRRRPELSAAATRSRDAAAWETSRRGERGRQAACKCVASAGQWPMANQQTGCDRPQSTWSRQLTAQLLQRLPCFYNIIPHSNSIMVTNTSNKLHFYIYTQFGIFSSTVYAFLNLKYIENRICASLSLLLMYRHIFQQICMKFGTWHPYTLRMVIEG